jgi:hypothetical protein
MGKDVGGRCAAQTPLTRGAPKGRIVQHELSVLALIRGKERFVYVYDDESRDELIEAIRAQAASPAVSLSWYDAAVLTERARRQAQDAGTIPGAPTKG